MKTYLLILCLLLVACTSEHTSDLGIKIGVNFPLTGGLSVYGEPLLEGFTLGMGEVNQQSNKSFKLIIEDNGGDPRSAVQAAKKLIEIDQVHLMITTMPGPSGAIAPIAEQAGTVLLYAAATDSFAEQNRYVFKDSVDAYYDCQVLAKEALGRGMRRVALFGPISEVVEDCKRALEEELGKLALYETYTRGDTDFRTSLTKMQAQKPDVAFLAAYADDCIVIWQQIRELGLQIPFMLPFAQSGCGEERAMTGMKTFSGTIIGLDFVVDKQGPEYQTFITHFRKKYPKKPDMPFFTILAYDWAHYIAKAFEQCVDPSDRECLKKAMENVTYEGALGAVRFKETHATFRPRVVIEFKEGKWVSPIGEKGLSVD